MLARVKLAANDVDLYDWDWWQRHGDEVAVELTAAFSTAFLAAAPEWEPALAQRLAVEYARARGAALLKLEGDINLMRLTRQRVRDIVADGLDEGQSIGQIAKAIRGDPVFGKARAELVARTETRTALGQGSMAAAQATGQNEKRWYTQGDARVEEECRRNERDNWIEISQLFSSGVDTIPQHPSCRCRVIYRTAELHPAASMEPRDVRCPDCKRLLAKAMTGSGELFCRHCRQPVTV